MNKEEIIRHAMQLGDAIASSEALDQLRQAQDAVTLDSTAYQAIMHFQNIRGNADNKLRQGLALSEKEESDLAQAEKGVQDNPKVKALIEAQEDFDNLMQSVYFVLNQAISGPSCGDGCEGCGGHCS